VTTVRAKPTDPDHYSYSVYADPAMAESFDAMRFGGPIGRLVGESQERVITAFLAPLAGRGGRRLLSRSRARPSPAWMPRRRCWPWPAAAPSTPTRR
jgi:hypothetical protein